MNETSQPIIFPVSAIHFPSIYVPRNYGPDPKGPEFYGFSVAADEVPMPLLARMKSRMWMERDMRICNFRGRHAPQVIVTGTTGGMVDMKRYMDAANLPDDLIFRDIPAEVCIVVSEFEEHRAGCSPKTAVVFAPVAIRVKYEDLIKQYDALCARYFTGA